MLVSITRKFYMIKKHWKDDRFLMVENDRFDYMYLGNCETRDARSQT